MLERLVITVLCLVQWTAACSNVSDIPLGLYYLSLYNVSVDAEHILEGPLYQLGDYDECVYKRKQQYCAVYVDLQPRENASYFWQEKQRLSSLAMNHRRDRLFVGVCTPENCNSTQIQMAMFNKLRPAADKFSIDVSVVLDPWNCQDRSKPYYVFADHLMCVIILILGGLVAAGSICEYRGGSETKETTTHSKVTQILLCFSLINNWKVLYSSPKLKSLHCIQGIRFFTAFLVIGIHEGFALSVSAKSNPEWLEENYSNVGKMLFINGHMITCSFLVISGFLLAYQSMELFEKSRFTLYIYLERLGRRYIRLTPALAVVIVFAAGWMNHLGSGPGWSDWTTKDVNYCRRNWWVSLLYLSNYIHADEMCMVTTWYLPVDFQSYAVFFLLLGLIHKYKLWINSTLASTLAICICIPLIQTYIEKLDPTFLTYPEYLHHLESYKTFLRSYITFHHNSGAYAVGIIAGYIFYRRSTNCNGVSKIVVAVLWTTSLALLLAVPLLGYFFYQPNFEYNVIIASIYAGFNKTLFAIGVASIIFLCSMGFGGILNKFLSCKLLQVLGRLTYCIYLIHPQILRAEHASSKTTIKLSEYLMLSKTVIHCVFTIFFSLILCLCVEMPFLTLLNMTTAAKSKEREPSVYVMTATETAPLSDKAVVVEENHHRQLEMQHKGTRL